MITIRNLVYSRGSKIILDGVNMDIPRGQMVSIMGPSGVGKTTILKLISGQLTPDEGTIEVNGQDVNALGHHELRHLRRDVGVLLQNGALFTDLTVYENIATPVREHTDLPEPLVNRLVMTKLRAVGLAGTQDLMPHELSGGMARRIALARAVVLDPAVMLYDEPTTGLDPIAVSTVRTLMRETNEALGLTSVIVTHNVTQMALLVDYCYIISEGKIAGEGRPLELEQSKEPGVDQFMNGKVDGPIPFHYQHGDPNWSLVD